MIIFLMKRSNPTVDTAFKLYQTLLIKTNLIHRNYTGASTDVHTAHILLAWCMHMQTLKCTYDIYL